MVYPMAKGKPSNETDNNCMVLLQSEFMNGTIIITAL